MGNTKERVKIDPWGFPLESFGPIGEWRTRYALEGKRGQGPPVDPSATLPNGDRLLDQQELTAALLSREDQFIRQLIRQLLTYGTGREPVLADLAEIVAIAEEIENSEKGFRDLVIAVATSEAFRRR